jgi:hypothetical protein
LDIDPVRMKNVSTLIITRFDRSTHRKCKGKVASSHLAPKAFILLSVEIKLHLFWMSIFFKLLTLLFNMESMFLIPTRRKNVYFILLRNCYIMIWAK